MPPGSSQALEPRGDVDAIAKMWGPVRDDVSTPFDDHAESMRRFGGSWRMLRPTQL